MDPTFFQTWVPIALGCVNLGGWIWAILQSPAKKNADAITKLADAIATNKAMADAMMLGLERRTATLEDAIKHLPDKESIHRLELNVSSMSGDMKALTETIKAVREISVMTRDMVAGGAN